VSLIENVVGKLRRSGIEPSEASAGRPAAHLLEGRSRPAEPEYAHRKVSLDLKALRAAGYLPEKEQERRLADHYRQIKRPLIEKALADPAVPEMRLILVTSPLPGDGKTFTSINLAMSLARERDTTILLIDADLPKAQISRAFGLEGEPGLVDALLDDELDVESLILRTDVRGLDILPAGKWMEGVAELIASARMTQIAARIASRNHRLVVLDSSPLLVSTEARALMHVPGQIAVVIRAGKTPREAVQDALSQVDKKKLQGLILNDANPAAGSGYYNYSYYGAPEDGSRRT
jgi:protein-tyrosine kinase